MSPQQEPVPLSPEARRKVILVTAALTVVGLSISAVILLLPERSRTIALHGLAIAAFGLGSLRAALSTYVSFRGRQRLLTALLAVLSVLLFLGLLIQIRDLRLFLAGP